MPKIDLTALGLTADLEAAIMAAGDGVAAGKAPAKKERTTIVTPHWEAAKAGIMPSPLVFPSPTHMQKHADRIHAMMVDGYDVRAYEVVGKKWASRTTRDYQNACAAYQAGQKAAAEAAEAEALSALQEALPDTPAVEAKPAKPKVQRKKPAAKVKAAA